MATEMETEIDGSGDYAVQSVLSSLDKLKQASTSKKTDNDILQALVNNPVVQSLAKAHTAMVEKKIYPAATDSSEISTRIVEHIDELNEDVSYTKLKRLLNKPHLMGLLKCHDDMAKKNEMNSEDLHGTTATSNSNRLSEEFEDAKLPRAIRIVGMYKKSWEPLGLTVVKANGQLKIARILRGSAIEKKALLHVDDIILEVNGTKLNGDPEKLQEQLHKTTGSVIFRILPSYELNAPPKLLYVKCHIDYDPGADDMIPCADAGLGFERGEILQVVEQKDDDWWQAQKVNNKGEARGRAGLIPSQSFEEKRRARQEMKAKTPSVKKKHRRKKHKAIYNALQNAEFDKHDIAVYEEVACLPPFSRKALVILTQSRSLAEDICQAIVDSNPDVFGMPDKNEPDSLILNASRDHSGDELHSDNSGSFQNQGLRPTREVMREGKTCVLMATPQSLKLLRTSEFMPYVVFVQLDAKDETNLPREDKLFNVNSSDIEKYYIQYIDAIIKSTSRSETAQAIINKLEQLKTKHQWVPTSWVY